MSLIQHNYKDSIDKVFECFKDTEKIIKKFEKSHHQLPIPSINELRYVGYHFLMATSETSDVSIRENIEKALNHCKRAKFDTFEASSMIFLEDLKIFNESYGKVVETQTVITNYVDKLSEINEIKNSIEDIITSDYESRENYYKEIQPLHDKLKIILELFKLAEPKIDILVEDNNQIKIRDSRRFTIKITLMVLGAIMSFVFFSFKLGFFSENREKQEQTQENMPKIKSISSSPSPKQSEN